MTPRLAVSTLALALLGACGYDATPPDAPPDNEAPAATAPAPAAPAAPETQAAPAQPMLVREGDPPYLADSSGAALYTLEGNTDGGACDTACEQVWPPVTSDTAQPVGAQGVDASAVATLQGRDGRNHVTYAGRPLYRYAGDRGANTTTGDDVEDEWGRWQLVRLDGTPPPGN
ncbi:COG4315 family predicted lipoprotein [Luteimonas kalidii]|uniref:Lipoprotein with Yx(FWY)xxD motif n=1 Tax=Luteimonas kalidii TaxID=3042025 RepID=A0ABT6JRW4_9GAMM|nr:hypothetical protein [Luteimonas kalidii]MDH5832891.1 hypothetical protein [Luteimonas kalidii]